MIFAGHFCHFHQLTIQALKSFLDSTALGIRINGSSFGSGDVSEPPAGEVCNVCEKQINADSSIHEVFCQGLVVCDQKDCERLFEDRKAMMEHVGSEHLQELDCRFGCNDAKLKPTNVKEHEERFHDLQECSLCDLINSSGNMKNHLREKHNVNLMTYEKAVTQTSSKLYRLSTKGKRVLCNFCDVDITKLVKEFSFLNHYQLEHEIKVSALIRNLSQNPIIDVILNDKKSRNEEDCLKNFTLVVEKSTEELVVIDFDCSKVFCVAADTHLEQKTRLPGLELCHSSKLECDFCNENSFEASCRLYEHLSEKHGFKLLNVEDQCTTCHTVLPTSQLDIEDDKKIFNLSLVCPIDSSFHVTKENFYNHFFEEHDADNLAVDRIIYKCIECNFAYKNLNEMRGHFAEAHPELILSYCKLCRYKLSSPSESSLHFDLNHADHEIKASEKLCCNLCAKDFHKRTSAKHHYETAHKRDSKNSFKCQFQLCNEAFNNKEDRKMHQLASF